MKRPRRTGASRSERRRLAGRPATGLTGGGSAGAALPIAGDSSAPDLYRSFFENAFNGVFQSTPSGKILAANPALVEMLGYESEDELKAIDIPDLYDDPSVREEVIDNLARAGEVRNQELTLRTKDGRRLFVLENSRAVSDATGRVVYYEGTLTNITAWREAESLFRSLAESSPVAIFIAQDLQFIFANRTFSELTGLTQEELSRTGPLKILPEEERDRALQNAMDMIGGKLTDAFEHRIIRRDGQVVWTLATVTLISYRGRPAILGNMIDITERKQAQDLLHTVAAASPVAIYIVQDNRFQFVNPQVVALTGRSEADLLAMDPMETAQPEDRERILANAHAVMRGEATVPYEHRIANAATGEVRWVMNAFTPIAYRGRPAILGNSVDITDRKLAEEQLARQAFYDSLTGLPNRALFMQRLEHALRAAARRRKPVAVMFLDLDDFKDVNDTFGHQAGDALLARLGERLQSCVRPTDTVARIGGDEFTILLEATDWRDDAIGVAQRIVRDLGEPFEVDGNAVRVTASVGLAFSTPDGNSAADLLREADVALYHAKAAGKGRYVIFGEHTRAA